MARKNILIINGHPNEKSFCQSIAMICESELTLNKDNNVDIIHIHKLKFDPILRLGYQGTQDLEEDLSDAKSLISKAQHIIIIYPNWWGMPPALLKGFVDRVFTPGFAFQYRKDSPMPEKLLNGKTSQLLITLDTPIWYYKFVMGAMGVKVMKRSVLGFCGIQNKRVSYFGPIRSTSEQDRAKILLQTKELMKEHL